MCLEQVLMENTGWDSPGLDLSTVDLAFAYTTCLVQHEGVRFQITKASRW
jgi:hypothetical protein